MLKTNVLFALVGLNKILRKQCSHDKQNHNKDVTNFGKSKYNLCNYIHIVQPNLLYYLHMVSGEELLDNIKHHVNNKQMNKNAHLINKNQIYELSDVKANAPLTHAAIYKDTINAIRKFDFSFDTADVSIKKWTWV